MLPVSVLQVGWVGAADAVKALDVLSVIWVDAVQPLAAVTVSV
jgi:hypothetical protein